MSKPTPARRPALILAASLAVLSLSAVAPTFGSEALRADDARSTPQAEQAPAQFDLEEVFPKRGSLFGPSVSSMEYSHDGKFAAFLYRPYDERRHGSDLYILNVETGESRRMTSASRLAKFSADAREVVEDRMKKLKAAKDPRLAAFNDDAADSLDGEYTGTASSSSAVLPDDADCTVMLNGKTGTMTTGLITVDLKDIERDGDDITAKLGKNGDDKGTLKATLNTTDGKSTLSGEATFDAGNLMIEFEVSAGGEEVAESGPSGILNATGEAYAAGDLIPKDDATVNDAIYDAAEARRNADLPPDSRAPKPAPRYAGISGLEWSPTDHEMLVHAEGDVYRLRVDAEEWDSAGEGEKPYRGRFERLTRTADREGSVAYLPDGSGYTYLRDRALIAVTFGDHKILQLDPPLEDGERMVAYRISPNLDRVVFLATKTDPNARPKTVNIVRYRNRLADVRQVPRTFPDDEMARSQQSIYLYDLTGHDREEGVLKRVMTRTVTGPRDVMMVPHWSPDSSKVAIGVFDQSTSQISILEAGFDEDETAAPSDDEKDDANAIKAATEDDIAAGEKGDEDVDTSTTRPTTMPSTLPSPEDGDFTIEDAKVVYRFLHTGGPNTPRMLEPRYLPDSQHIVFIAEISGFRHLHVLDPVYEQLEQVTTGKREIYPFDQSDDHRRLYVTATVEGDPAQEWLYSVDLETREMRRLCKDEGVIGSVAVSDDGTKALAVKSDFGRPRELIAYDCPPGGEVEATVMSDSHVERTMELAEVKPEYFSFENRHGQTIYGHMFKPEDWSPDDKRPLLIYVYGGPLGERKMITRGAYSGPSYWFARYMAQEHGYVTATIDPRGASGFGAVFEKANFQRIGEPQTEDLVDAADWLVENAGVDRDRRSLHGWSFGGFQTQMTMYTEPDAFAVGIAGAGPTEWQNYNMWYTQGTVGPKADFKKDLDQYSLLPLAKNLTGRLLLVHGVEDSNVLYQDTVRVYRKLLQAGKAPLVDLFIDPTGGHGMGGDVQSLQRYQKYEDFLLTHLGTGEPAATEESEESEAAEEAEPEADAPATPAAEEQADQPTPSTRPITTTATTATTRAGR